MKKLILLAFLSLTPLSFNSCAQPGTTSSAIVSKDPVVDAEKLTITAEATFNTVFTLERQNHDMIVKYAPTVHEAVQSLRQRTQPLLTSVRHVTKVAKDNGSDPASLASVNAILKTLRSAVDEALTYQTQITSTKAP